MNENGAIRFEGVSKSFGARTVLRDISFTVAAGTAYVLLGRSGSGKSVTLKLICGLIKPDAGKIQVENAEVTGLDSTAMIPIRKQMGFLFQSSALFDSISVGENVAFAMRRHTNKPNQEIHDLAQKALDKVGLGKEYDSMPSSLSGGMRKRAGLARALALEPSILLVDEPSAGLDPITSSEIDDLLLTIKPALDEAMAVILQFPRNGPLMVEGYATAGTASEQFLRARRRAALVRTYLIYRFHLRPNYTGIVAMGAAPVDGATGEGVRLVSFYKK